MKRDQDVLDRIRQELLSILERQHKILERDLLRLSAMTGVAYSTIVRIQKEIPSYRLSRSDLSVRRRGEDN